MPEDDPQLSMLAMFPLSVVLFPHEVLPLQIFEPRYVRLLQDCQQGSGEFGIVLISRGAEVGGGDERFSVGTVARIERVSESDQGRKLLLVRGARRVRIAEWLADDPYPLALVEEITDDGELPDQSVLERAESSVRRLRALIARLGGPPQLEGDFSEIPDALERSWRFALAAPFNPLDGQAILEAVSVTKRMEKLIDLADALHDDLSHMEGLEQPEGW